MNSVKRRKAREKYKIPLEHEQALAKKKLNKKVEVEVGLEMHLVVECEIN